MAFSRIIISRVRVIIFWRNLRPVLGKLVSSTFDKKTDPLLYITQFYYQALRYNIVCINGNFQAAIIFNNLGILTLVGTME